MHIHMGPNGLDTRITFRSMTRTKAVHSSMTDGARRVKPPSQVAGAPSSRRFPPPARSTAAARVS